MVICSHRITAGKQKGKSKINKNDILYVFHYNKPYNTLFLVIVYHTCAVLPDTLAAQHQLKGNYASPLSFPLFWLRSSRPCASVYNEAVEKSINGAVDNVTKHTMLRRVCLCSLNRHEQILRVTQRVCVAECRDESWDTGATTRYYTDVAKAGFQP